MWGLEGRTVLVTGASGGIGGATVRQLVAAGADVVASGRSVEVLDDLKGKTGCRSLPRHPFDPDASPISAHIPFLVGTNHDESRLLIGRYFDLTWETLPETLAKYSEKMGKLDLNDPALLVPGSPERSMLLYRMKQVNEHRMPRVASSVVDADGVRLVEEWIKQLH